MDWWAGIGGRAGRRAHGALLGSVNGRRGCGMAVRSWGKGGAVQHRAVVGARWGATGWLMAAQAATADGCSHPGGRKARRRMPEPPARLPSCPLLPLSRDLCWSRLSARPPRPFRDARGVIGLMSPRTDVPPLALPRSRSLRPAPNVRARRRGPRANGAAPVRGRRNWRAPQKPMFANAYSVSCLACRPAAVTPATY